MRGIHALLERVDVSDRTGGRLLRLLTGGVYVFLYAPIVIVIALSFTEARVPAFPMEGFTLEWYATMLEDERLTAAVFQSLQIGVLAAIGAGIVGTITALGMVRNDFDSRLLDASVLNTVFMSPVVVPWVVTGIAMLTLYNLFGVQGTMASVVFGHVIITLPFVILVVSSRLYGFDRSLEEAAKNLGASETRAFLEVTFPLILPGVVAGMLFAFTISFDNFTQTFFWIGTNTETLPIVIYSMIRTGLNPSINAVGTVIVVFSLSIVLVAELLSSRVID
ncbi:ABC transporter permease [Halopenitus persicus]|uniref:Spermidine/putrescine transport system permease protein n=1 Tax=Halopenitus persicus TaxID=1048396 RepID=A0A1H3H9N4_9EURY|nr:ABC transporter permease [Halopenitus persicus]SDY11925.1 spermidine/putrescine transport system permease protein [Halopenitus persicus]